METVRVITGAGSRAVRRASVVAGDAGIQGEDAAVAMIATVKKPAKVR